jgi:uncharacterized protein (DUF302 family)
MNIAYFRKSKKSYHDTLASLRRAATDSGFTLLGEAALPGGNATVINICRPEWARTVVDTDPQLLGLLPCSVSVIEKGGEVLVGSPSPAILAQAAPTEEIAALVTRRKAAFGPWWKPRPGRPHEADGAQALLKHSVPTARWRSPGWTGRRPHTSSSTWTTTRRKPRSWYARPANGRAVTEVSYEGGESEFIVGFDRARLEKLVASM